MVTEKMKLVFLLLADYKKMFPDYFYLETVEIFSRLNDLSIDDLNLLVGGTKNEVLHEGDKF